MLVVCLGLQQAQADGPVGDHVNDLKGHVDEYTSEVAWLIGKVDGIVSRYAEDGREAATPAAVIDHWEAVKFHSAIESNYVPLYASIWQGLFGVRQAIEAGQPLDVVRAEQTKLEQTLWQALGSVKLAAQYQSQGLLEEVQTRQATRPAAILVEVGQKLDRVLAKYAERLADEAIGIIQETYVSRFESVEAELKALDADLVENLEIDFNVILPKAIEAGASVDEVREIILAMQAKLDTARSRLKDAERDRAETM